MSILFPYNQTAYENTVSMLAATGRAAVIHPTGTGKSFIGFQLAADNPKKSVCWLAPSETIYRTQCENWGAAGGTACPNIRFFTYARLMLMDNERLAEIRPDYIVLDEFHRAGAKMWGAGVETLLRMYENVPVLGLSATNIRYLDSQRDMAEELFDGNIASVMSLGEAIVTGILAPPKYVLSVYNYKNDLAKYEARLQKTDKTVNTVRSDAADYLEALKRALENADGLDEVFAKHMTEKTGKYLVFCADAAHMEEMIEKAPEWFKGVDEAPHIYRAYSEDPGTDQAFADFKADKSEHLKLLYCIDMLNEGVHVEDVDGVILLRPTVSPIIYKQQIGRALTAGKTKTPVIFDVVLNIENICSIRSIEEEMNEAVQHYRMSGEYERIVTDRFEIIDETRDCRRLFAAFEESLCASWDLMYAQARAYYQEHGNLNVPVRYKTEKGLCLGSWLNTQRKVYLGKAEGVLTDRQVALLEEIGISWHVLDARWERNFAEAKAYYEAHGDLLVPATYVTESGVKLGSWIAHQRMLKKGSAAGRLSEVQIQKLTDIGMAWDADEERFKIGFEEAKVYHREHGNLNVPATYRAPSGYALGRWINLKRRQYKKGTLTSAQIEALDGMSMLWRIRNRSAQV